MIFSDFPHKYVKRLPQKIDLIERDMLALEVITEESFANVKWLKDDEELKITRKRNQRMKILSKDCHHILVVEKCTVDDGGCYSVSTNTETTSCQVNITDYPYRIVDRPPETVIVTEDGKAELELTVEDQNADVIWFHEGSEIKTEKSRYLNKPTLNLSTCDKSNIQNISNCHKICLLLFNEQ